MRLPLQPEGLTLTAVTLSEAVSAVRAGHTRSLSAWASATPYVGRLTQYGGTPRVALNAVGPLPVRRG